MYSSLPSASKIYVQSTKTKHKNLNSAKKKRKKATATTNICSSVHIYDEDTLVSSTFRDRSSSQLSLSSHEESLEKEKRSEYDREIKNSCSDNFEENKSTDLKINSKYPIKEVCISERSENQNSPCSVSTDCENLIFDNENSNSIKEEMKDISNVTADSIYCDEVAASDDHKDVELQTNSDLLDLNCIPQISELKSCNSRHEKYSEQSTDYENVPPIFPEIRPTSENYTLQKSESTSNIVETGLSKKSVDTYLNDIPTKDVIHETGEFTTDNSNSGTFFSPKIICENDEVLIDDPCVLKETKDTLKVVLDIDRSSVHSDCYQSSNIYDIHIINSEHDSVDENQISSSEDCRVQSPGESEKSCTESTIHDSRIICHNDSPDRKSLVSEKLHKKNVITQSNHGNFTCMEKFYDISNSSSSFTNFEELQTSNIIKRSLSLPAKLSDLQSTNFSGDKFSQDIFINGKKKLDKSTFTVDESTLKSSKSTATLGSINKCFNKKDVATTPLKSESRKPSTQNKSVTTSFKDNTLFIMKVLPPVAVLQARARSYVFGSIGPTGSLLGNEELSRFFPDNKVTIFVGTWNMNGHDPPDSVDDFLLPLEISSVPDIYAVGIQESMQSRSEWEILLQTTLGPSHVLFSSTSFGVLHLSIFMRRDLIWFCSEPEEANVAVRPGSMIKTKGAVAICFMFFGTSFLFVNSHLTAHEQKLRERLADYEKICASLDLPKQIPLKPHQKGKDVTSRFDCVFWSGDLNFRVVQDRSSVLSFVEDKIRRQSSCNSLTEHDQLTQAMAKGMAFHGFNEGVINFIPSYKFDVGTSFFDSTKQRVPSYTDRILYRCKDKSSIVCSHYNAVKEIFTSDHKPVYGVFKVALKPGRDNIHLSGGLFKREIYLEAIKRRAQQLEVNRNHKQSTICCVM